VQGWQPDTIKTSFEVIDERFAAVGGDGRTERLYASARWTEGPVYYPAGRYLLFSDIPNDRLLRWDEPSGAVSIFREPSGYANGHTLDPLGRLVTCEQGNRRVTRTEHDGSVTVLADRFNDKRLNSPNDVVVRADGSFWFTDPSYGIDSDYEGNKADSEIGACHVYRIDPGGQLEIVGDDFERPNGLAFTADQQRLFIVDTRRKHIRTFEVTAENRLTGGDVFCECTAGTFDGIRFDDAGRLWAATYEGLHCFAADGSLIGKMLLPEITSNLTFGGRKRNHLFVTASSSVYSLRMNVAGAR
jgi:gluconolactonase